MRGEDGDLNEFDVILLDFNKKKICCCQVLRFDLLTDRVPQLKLSVPCLTLFLCHRRFFLRREAARAVCFSADSLSGLSPSARPAVFNMLASELRQ
jgi:hypothetical protein